jgi:hypothetical protein
MPGSCFRPRRVRRHRLLPVARPGCSARRHRLLPIARPGCSARRAIAASDAAPPPHRFGWCESLSHPCWSVLGGFACSGPERHALMIAIPAHFGGAVHLSSARLQSPDAADLAAAGRPDRAASEAAGVQSRPSDHPPQVRLQLRARVEHSSGSPRTGSRNPRPAARGRSPLARRCINIRSVCRASMQLTTRRLIDNRAPSRRSARPWARFRSSRWQPRSGHSARPRAGRLGACIVRPHPRTYRRLDATRGSRDCRQRAACRWRIRAPRLIRSRSRAVSLSIRVSEQRRRQRRCRRVHPAGKG